METKQRVREWIRSGYGYGYGSGSGYGRGSIGLCKYCGEIIYIIDNVPTIFDRIIGNLAKARILCSDLTTDPCYVVKGNGFFAHGKTPEAAAEALREKIMENMDSDEAIRRFCDEFQTAYYSGEKFPASKFYEWHHYLTGSCEMGRKHFMARYNIKMEDEFTVAEFIALTLDDYGGDVIKSLKKALEKDERKTSMESRNKKYIKPESKLIALNLEESISTSAKHDADMPQGGWWLVNQQTGEWYIYDPGQAPDKMPDGVSPIEWLKKLFGG